MLSSTITLSTTITPQVDQFIQRIYSYQPKEKNSFRGSIRYAYQVRVQQDLTIIFTENDHDFLIESIKNYLADNWNMINGTLLSYTVMPEDELTILLCDLAVFVKNNMKNVIQDPAFCALTILMPTISVESLRDDNEYPSLYNSNIDIKEILKTHILGREGKYLIPVKQLIDLQEIPQDQWFNIYFNYSNHSAKMDKLNTEEYQRLIRHSPDSEAVYKAKIEYDLSMKEDNSLLFQLNNLCNHLYFNSVDGIGRDEDAKAGAYNAIIEFNNYYNMLDNINKNAIPEIVKEQIKSLLDISSNPNDNFNAIENFNTCIAIRRKILKKSIVSNENEIVLSKIFLSQSNKTNLLEEKKQSLDRCRAQFKRLINNRTYYGTDKGLVTSKLLQEFNITFYIDNIEDLQDLLKIKTSDLIVLCQDHAIQKEIVDQFDNLEDLVAFFHEAPMENLKTLLFFCGEQFADKIIFSEGENFLSDFLTSFDAEYCLLFCETMKNSIYENIKYPYTFRRIVRLLSPTQIDPLFEIMKPAFAKILNSILEMELIFQVISSEQQDFILNELINHDKLMKMINPSWGMESEIIELFNFLSPAQRDIVFNKFILPNNKIFLDSIVRVEIFFEVFSFEQEDIVINQFIVPNPERFITIVDDVNILFKLLPPEKYIVIFDKIKNILPEIFKNLSNCSEELLDELIILGDLINMVRPGTDDFIFLISMIPEQEVEKRLSVCNQIAFVHQLVLNVDQDFPKIEALFKTIEGKKQFQNYYFKSLLSDMNLTDAKFVVLNEKLHALHEQYFITDAITEREFYENSYSLMNQINDADTRRYLSKWLATIKVIMDKKLIHGHSFFGKHSLEQDPNDDSKRRIRPFKG